MTRLSAENLTLGYDDRAVVIDIPTSSCGRRVPARPHPNTRHPLHSPSLWRRVRSDADTEGRSRRRDQRHAATGPQPLMFNATQRNTMNDEEQHQQSEKRAGLWLFSELTDIRDEIPDLLG